MLGIRFKSAWTPRYIAALVITANLLIFINFITYYIIENEKNDSSLINISGKQRMLTKEIALQCTQLVNSETPLERQQTRQNLLAASQQLKASHAQLVASSILRVKYYEKSSSLDDKVSKYINDVNILLQLSDSELVLNGKFYLSDILSAASGDLLNLLDDAVTQIERENEAKISRLQKIEQGFLILALLVLLLEAHFIFRPMVTSIEQEKQSLLAAKDELERISFVDGLTGIANRRYFDEFLRREVERAAREQTPLSLIMIDIDFFKAYNDTYGHLAGDDCLKQVASSLRNTVRRPTDLVARYGGEEFAVILPNTSLEGAIRVAEKLRQNIEALKLPHLGSPQEGCLTISLGVASSSTETKDIPTTLIAKADSALYSAKRSGRNRVEYEKPSLATFSYG